MTTQCTETWVCDTFKTEIAYDDEIPATIPIAGDLCDDCAAATKANCMDCKRQYRLTELSAEYPDWQGWTHDEGRLLCEKCEHARWVTLCDEWTRAQKQAAGCRQRPKSPQRSTTFLVSSLLQGALYEL